MGVNSHQSPRFAKKLKFVKKLIVAEEAHRLRGAEMILFGAGGKSRAICRAGRSGTTGTTCTVDTPNCRVGLEGHLRTALICTYLLRCSNSLRSSFLSKKLIDFGVQT